MRRILTERAVILGFAAVLGLLIAGWLLDRYRNPRLNVVLVCLDTVRYDTFWLPESAGLADPLSEWTKRAIRFRNAYSVAPWTIPSVASVWTGLWPRHHRAGQFPGSVHDLSTQIPTALPEDLPTLPELLREAGFRTATFSAHPWMSISEFGLSRGFQHQVTDQDDRILEEVFRWLLHSRRSEPFFLNLHFMAAHDWYRRPSQVVRWNLENLDPELASAARGSAPFAVPNPPDSNTLRFLEYVRSVAFLRNQLVRILTTLSEADLLSRTIVFVYADHGEEFQDHREQGLREAADPRNIYGQGHGHSLYQEQLRIPMLAWVPGRDGVDIAAPASLVDVAPTLLSWLGRSRLGPSWDGIDLEDFAAASDENPERPLFATGIAYGPPGSTVVVGNWKLIRMDGREDQLFNLSSDPRELRPLQGSALVKAGELGRLLDQVAPPARKVLPPVISPEQLESLRALGYISGTEQ